MLIEPQFENVGWEGILDVDARQNGASLLSHHEHFLLLEVLQLLGGQVAPTCHDFLEILDFLNPIRCANLLLVEFASFLENAGVFLL